MSDRTCALCGDEFNLQDKLRRKIPGLSIHCPDCSSDNTVRYAGVAGADGKQASISILKFDNQLDREGYLRYFKNNSGLYKGKSCQMGMLAKTPNIKFQTVAVNLNNVNAKGKA